MGIFSKKRKKTNQKTHMLIARGNRLIQILMIRKNFIKK